MNPSGYLRVSDPIPGAAQPPGAAPFMPVSAVMNESALVPVPAAEPLVSVRLEDSSGHCSSIPFADDSYNAAIAPYVTRDVYAELMGRVLQASRATFLELCLKVIAGLVIIGGMILFLTIFGSNLSDGPPTTKIIASFAMFIGGGILFSVVQWLGKGWREERVRGAVADASNACAQRRLPLYWRVTKEPIGRWVRGSSVVGTIYAFTVEILLLVAVAQPRIQAADWANGIAPGGHAAYQNPNF